MFTFPADEIWSDTNCGYSFGYYIVISPENLITVMDAVMRGDEVWPNAEDFKEPHDLTSAYTMQQNDDGTWSTNVKLAGYAAGGKALAKANKGETVTLKIGTIPDGKRFKEWEVVNGDVVITNFTNPDGASFTMEDKDVTINAVFEDIPAHSVTVVSGKAFAEADDIIDNAFEDTIVTIVADDAPDGKVFDKWKVLEGGVTIADVNSATTTFTMLAADVKVEATYKNADLSHSHVYGDSLKSDEDNHWKECECGDKAEFAAHTFAWKTDKEATKTETGLKHEECSVCGYKRNENTEIAKLADSSNADKTEPNSTSESSDPAKTEEHDGPSSPRTGSYSDISLWIALTLISGGALVAAKVFSKKRKTNKA